VQLPSPSSLPPNDPVVSATTEGSRLLLRQEPRIDAATRHLYDGDVAAAPVAHETTQVSRSQSRDDDGRTAACNSSNVCTHAGRLALVLELASLEGEQARDDHRRPAVWQRLIPETDRHRDCGPVTDGVLTGQVQAANHVGR
jgi:hypothetical protein